MKKPNTGWSLKSAIQNCETTSLQETDISPRYRESVFNFCHGDVVNGRIKTFMTPDIEVSRMDIDSTQDLTTLQDDLLERQVSTFVRRGNIRSRFKFLNDTFEQNKQQHTFVHAHSNESEHTIASGSTSIIYLNLKPGLLQSFMPEWERYADKLSGKKMSNQFYISPVFQIQQNSRLNHILSEIYGDTFCDVTRYVYLEAKAIELLALQLDELLQQAGTKPQTFALSKTDHGKLVAMHEYITSNYLEPLSLSSLARMFTLNEYKIKKGFKQLYRQPVFNYIHTLKMQKAEALLRHGDLMVNEVSDIVGYSSIHNFSNAFYKMYKYRPGTLRASRSYVHLQN